MRRKLNTRHSSEWLVEIGSARFRRSGQKANVNDGAEGGNARPSLAMF